jgi:uncharacterized membrane protein YphA (DoxX/SURF4 family)
MQGTMNGAMHLRMMTLTIIRMGLGLVWIAAGFTKLRSLATTRAAVVQLAPVLDRLPGKLPSVAAGVLPPGELLLGGLMLAGWRIGIFASLSACLFLLFAVLIAAAGIRGALAAGDCGCFGGRRASTGGDPGTTGRLWARNLVLALLALMVARHS